MIKHLKYVAVYILLVPLSHGGIADTFPDNSNAYLIVGDEPAGDTGVIAPPTDDTSQTSSQLEPSSSIDGMSPPAADEMPEPSPSEMTDVMDQTARGSDDFSQLSSSKSTGESNQMDSEADNLNPSVTDDASIPSTDDARDVVDENNSSRSTERAVSSVKASSDPLVTSSEPTQQQVAQLIAQAMATEKAAQQAQQVAQEQLAQEQYREQAVAQQANQAYADKQQAEQQLAQEQYREQGVAQQANQAYADKQQAEQQLAQEQYREQGVAQQANQAYADKQQAEQQLGQEQYREQAVAQQANQAYEGKQQAEQQLAQEQYREQAVAQQANQAYADKQQAEQQLAQEQYQKQAIAQQANQAYADKQQVEQQLAQEQYQKQAIAQQANQAYAAKQQAEQQLAQEQHRIHLIEQKAQAEVRAALEQAALERAQARAENKHAQHQITQVEEQTTQKNYRDKAKEKAAQHQVDQTTGARTTQNRFHTYSFHEVHSADSNSARDGMTQQVVSDHESRREKISKAKAKIAEMEAQDKALAEATNTTKEISTAKSFEKSLEGQHIHEKGHKTTVEKVKDLSTESSPDEHGNSLQKTDTTPNEKIEKDSKEVAGKSKGEPDSTLGIGKSVGKKIGTQKSVEEAPKLVR